MVDLEGPIREAQTRRAQQVMREEMEAGLHKPSVAIKGQDRPLSVGAVLEQEFGPVSTDADVARMAHTLLEEHCTGIVNTGIKEWAAIQRAMEAAVRFDPRDL